MDRKNAEPGTVAPERLQRGYSRFVPLMLIQLRRRIHGIAVPQIRARNLNQSHGVMSIVGSQKRFDM
jgi:hypothetical protein